MLIEDVLDRTISKVRSKGMTDKGNYIYSKDADMLQIPHAEYLGLMEQMEEAERLQEIKASVLTDLQSFLADGVAVKSAPKGTPKAKDKLKDQPKSLPQEDAPENIKAPVEKHESVKTAPPEKGSGAEVVPPIKKDIAEHFNKFDESGKMFDVFKQYYLRLNEDCGGAVCVSLKDGVCNLLNYDELEDFAFVDIFSGQLRIALDPRYEDALDALELCEVPRLLSRRRNLICVKVNHLDDTLIEVLTKAYSEAGA